MLRLTKPSAKVMLRGDELHPHRECQVVAGLLSRAPDYPDGGHMERLDQFAAPRLAKADALFALLLLGVTFALRLKTLGDTNFFIDDEFYFLVGQRMHDGLVPYVDIWDRKPLGLFILFYLIAAVSSATWAYQIAAWCFLAATAWTIHRIVMTWTNRQGAVFAGIAYLVLTCIFDGVNGQAPVFYNLFVAGAVLLIVRDFPSLGQGVCSWRVWLAMALLGLGITIKQTVLIEALFLGCFVLWQLRSAGAPLRKLLAQATGFAVIGAAPTLAIAGYYAAAGHWHEFWHAMVTANLHKQSIGGPLMTYGLMLIVVEALPISLIVAWAFMSRLLPDKPRHFLLGWLLSALAGFIVIPNFFNHYVLPVTLPLSVIAGFVFSQNGKGRIAFAAACTWLALWYNPADFAYTQRSIAGMNRLAALISAHDGGGGLLVYDGPPYLYALTDKQFLSPLAFPTHLNHDIERDVSHLKTSDEMDRIIAGRPGVVVIARFPEHYPVNIDSDRKIRNYINRNCRVVGSARLWTLGDPNDILVFGDCGRSGLGG